MTTGTGATGGSWAAASPTNGQGPPTVIIIPDDMTSTSQLAPSVTDYAGGEDPTAAGPGHRPVHDDPDHDVPPPPQKWRRRGQGGVRRNASTIWVATLAWCKFLQVHCISLLFPTLGPCTHACNVLLNYRYFYFFVWCGLGPGLAFIKKPKKNILKAHSLLSLLSAFLFLPYFIANPPVFYYYSFAHNTVYRPFLACCPPPTLYSVMQKCLSLD